MTDARIARPRALFLAGDLPWPPESGGKMGTYRILEALTRWYDVDLIAMADTDDRTDLAELERICRRVDVVRIPFTFGRHRVTQALVLARSLLTREPYRLRKFRSREFERLVRQRLTECRYDLIDCDQFGVVPYVELLPAGTTIVAGHHNIESQLYRLAAQESRSLPRRLFTSFEARKLRRAESTLLARFDRVFVVAPDDVELLAEMGVDRATALPMPAEVRTQRKSPPPGHRIISVGSMSWYGVADGLLWFHDRVLPLVRRNVPDVVWEIAGPNAPASIRKLAADPRIEVPGFVDDLDAHLTAARAGIVPLQVAAGIRQKLLYFMGLGLPSVSTTVGARGLSFADGQGCFRRDDPEGFAAALVELLTDDGAWLATVGAGRAFVLGHHSQAQFDGALAEGLRLARSRHDGAPLDSGSHGQGGVGNRNA